MTIPSIINGLPVSSIAYRAFAGNYSLTSVTILKSVTSIGRVAFYSCTNLTNVTINGVIGDSPFNYCTQLRKDLNLQLSTARAGALQGPASNSILATVLF